ncbi:hypothetical protein IJG04_02340 [Candidatus Saccharibacteria bacterium]|nr:hypothetical protein [Candidatus Saccharibacteria bacterium]
MVDNKNKSKKREGVIAHRKVQSSTVTNRRGAKTTPKIQKFYREELSNQKMEQTMPKASRQIKVEVAMPEEQMMMPENQAEMVMPEGQMKMTMPEKRAEMTMPEVDMSGVHEQMRSRVAGVQEPAKMTAKEIKKQEIDKVMAEAVRKSAKETKKSPKKFKGVGMDWKRVLLALGCAGVIVFAIAYFVNINSPDISMKVAAMQTGIDASYPSYTPRGYSLTDITSESGKITLNFKESSTDDGYSLIEEKTSWDSNALLNNYVKDEFSDYSTIKEQGLTIYISGSNAVWVNGGVLYKIKISQGSLTKKQIITIATSL